MTPRQVAIATIIGAGAATANACAPSTHPLRETHKIDAELLLQKVPEIDAAARAKLNLQPPKWPLKFKEHTFMTVCYSTQICRVWYAGAWSGFRKPMPPSTQYGPRYLDHVLGGHIGIANFPDPAEVTWRSMDGTEHQALIDIGAIFHDEVARHNVPREEVADLVDGELSGDPQILLEVNDRTIRVYIRTYVPTKHFQIPGNPYSSSRDELILAKTYHY